MDIVSINQSINQSIKSITTDYCEFVSQLHHTIICNNNLWHSQDTSISFTNRN